jgi:exopolysaccharide biosynthesis polyprenyl glycosylphosphotransferase
MYSSEHWNLGKLSKMLSCLAICVTSCVVVTLFFSPQSETLLQVSPERLLLYSLVLGCFLLVTGEMVGLFENSIRKIAWKRILQAFFSSGASTFGLLVFVWLIEFDFIGRFAILKIFLSTGLGTYIFVDLLNSFSNRNPWRVMALVDASRRKIIIEETDPNFSAFEWIESKTVSTQEEHFDLLLNDCRENRVEILIIEGKNSKFREAQVMDMLASGVRVMFATDFIETFCRKIPSTDLDHRWLAQLNLKQRDPLLRRIKRLIDLIFSVLGLILCVPVLFLAGVSIVIESGFPIFFCQTRSGLLGRPYTLYKLRTMNKQAEKSGAQWAKEDDDRITFVGRFLRKARIDEIPQFLNVINGQMSIVGPRPERPELEESIQEQLPYWKCRYLLKPGLTGWAQIRFKYASDMESSEEKLAYDLYYIKNASFFLDLEIILSTLRSFTNGSR